MEIVQFVFSHGLDILGGIALILSGVIVIAELIPGNEPEATLYKIVDFIKKFSKK